MRLFYWSSLLWAAMPVVAQETDCAAFTDAVTRLACYDRTHERDATHTLPAGGPAEGATPATRHDELINNLAHENATLTQRWELEPATSRGRFTPRAYKPVYLLPFTRTNHVNDKPTSPAPDHQSTDSTDLEARETKFQISLKSKLWEGVIGEYGNLWAGYTQSSRWQVDNRESSRPFRETNYEPELMLVFRTSYELFGWSGRVAALSINHQSNGRPLPLSRSWNRIIGEVDFERGDSSLSLRPWWKLREDPGTDDNPDIEDYMGRGEMLFTHKYADHVFTLQARHSLRSGERSRGSLQLEWAFPLATGLHGYLQIFSGYGECLIDYNFRQTKVGLGVSVVEWR